VWSLCGWRFLSLSYHQLKAFLQTSYSLLLLPWAAPAEALEDCSWRMEATWLLSWRIPREESLNTVSSNSLLTSRVGGGPLFEAPSSLWVPHRCRLEPGGWNLRLTDSTCVLVSTSIARRFTNTSMGEGLSQKPDENCYWSSKIDSHSQNRLCIHMVFVALIRNHLLCRFVVFLHRS